MKIHRLRVLSGQVFLGGGGGGGGMGVELIEGDMPPLERIVESLLLRILV